MHADQFTHDAYRSTALALANARAIGHLRQSAVGFLRLYRETGFTPYRALALTSLVNCAKLRANA